MLMWLSGAAVTLKIGARLFLPFRHWPRNHANSVMSGNVAHSWPRVCGYAEPFSVDAVSLDARIMHNMVSFSISLSLHILQVQQKEIWLGKDACHFQMPKTNGRRKLNSEKTYRDIEQGE